MGVFPHGLGTRPCLHLFIRSMCRQSQLVSNESNREKPGDYQRSSGELVGGVCVEAVLESKEQVNDVVEDVNGQHKQPRQVVQQLGVQSLVLSFNPS